MPRVNPVVQSLERQIAILRDQEAGSRREAIKECVATLHSYVDELEQRGANPDEFDYVELADRLHRVSKESR